MPEETLLENPLAIIGEEDAVSGFRAFGFKTYSLKTKDEFKSIIDEIARSKIAVCLVEDDIYNLAKEEIDLYKNLPLPVFLPFSRKLLEKDLLNEIVKDIRIKATGAF